MCLRQFWSLGLEKASLVQMQSCLALLQHQMFLSCFLHMFRTLIWKQNLRFVLLEPKSPLPFLSILSFFQWFLFPPNKVVSKVVSKSCLSFFLRKKHFFRFLFFCQKIKEKCKLLGQQHLASSWSFEWTFHCISICRTLSSILHLQGPSKIWIRHKFEQFCHNTKFHRFPMIVSSRTQVGRIEEPNIHRLGLLVLVGPSWKLIMNLIEELLRFFAD